METQTPSEGVAAHNWKPGLTTSNHLAITTADEAVEAAPAGVLPALLAGWSVCDRVVIAYLLWMLLFWLTAGPVQHWKWVRLDLLVLLYFILIATALRRVVAHPLGRAAHASFLLWAALPLGYWQSGSFGTRFRPSIEPLLIRTDRVVFGIDWLTRRPPTPGWTDRILESVYMSNYALVLGCITLFLLLAVWVEWIGWKQVNGRRLSDDVQAVLLALMVGLLACYAWFPLLPAITPRLFFAQLNHPAAVHSMRAVNGWFLRRDSIPWGVFPCAHVAGVSAMACAFWKRGWLRTGGFYFIAAILTGIATVYGDYHFACDAVAGALIGIVATLLALHAAQRRETTAALAMVARAAGR